MQHNPSKTVCAITLIDEIIGGLCRKGPTKDRSYASFSQSTASHFCELSAQLGWQRTTALCFPNVKGGVNYDIGTLVVPHALKTARAYLEVLYDYDSKIARLPYISQFSAYLCMTKWSLDDFVSNAKYAIAYPLARYLNQVLPVRPASFLSNPFLFSGSIKRFLKNRLMAHCPKNCSLFLSILQGIKRGAEIVPDSYVLKAMIKHRIALTKTPTINWYMASKFEPYFHRFFSKFPDLLLNCSKPLPLPPLINLDQKEEQESI